MGILDFIDITPLSYERKSVGVKPVSSSARINKTDKKKRVREVSSDEEEKKDRPREEDVPLVDLSLYDEKGRPREIYVPETKEVRFPSGGGSFQEVFKRTKKGVEPCL